MPNTHVDHHGPAQAAAFEPAAAPAEPREQSGNRLGHAVPPGLRARGARTRRHRRDDRADGLLRRRGAGGSAGGPAGGPRRSPSRHRGGAGRPGGRLRRVCLRHRRRRLRGRGRGGRAGGGWTGRLVRDAGGVRARGAGLRGLRPELQRREHGHGAGRCRRRGRGLGGPSRDVPGAVPGGRRQLSAGGRAAAGRAGAGARRHAAVAAAAAHLVRRRLPRHRVPGRARRRRGPAGVELRAAGVRSSRLSHPGGRGHATAAGGRLRTRHRGGARLPGAPPRSPETLPAHPAGRRRGRSVGRFLVPAAARGGVGRRGPEARARRDGRDRLRGRLDLFRRRDAGPRQPAGAAGDARPLQRRLERGQVGRFHGRTAHRRRLCRRGTRQGVSGRSRGGVRGPGTGPAVVRNATRTRQFAENHRWLTPRY
ncbi:hypothetical protein SGPA1_41172 [Streptomyces misionensis JCM 4497]